MNMVEKVAKAIGNCGHETDWDDCLEFAKAAIKAMRDPTDTMVAAGKDEISVDERDPWVGERERGAKGVWWAMINAALK